MRFKALLYRQLRARLLRRETDLPRPHLLIGVGHRTHLPLLIARLVCGGKSIVLMKPSLPQRWFDLLFIPQHDRHRRTPNVIETRGVICPTTDAAKDPSHGLILLGGANPHFVWSIEQVAAQITAIVEASPDVRWQVCDSRRTPTRIGRGPAHGGEPDLPTLALHATRLPRKGTGESHLRLGYRRQRPRCSTNPCRRVPEWASSTWRPGIPGAATNTPGGSVCSPPRDMSSWPRPATTSDGDAASPRFTPENHRCAQMVVDWTNTGRSRRSRA